MVGPNGAGKSTLFRMIMRQEEPDEGQVSIDRGVTVGHFSQDVGEMSGRSAGRGDHGRRRPGLVGGGRAARPGARAGRSGPGRRAGDAGGAVRSRAGPLRRAGRLRAGGAGARDPGRPGLLARHDGRRRGGRSPAGGRCAWRWRASCSCARTACCWTSPPTTSTWSRSSGWRSSCRRTTAPC
ncbi:MAG: ATP-binding cassette domain-containing protein [Anaeromyxobacter sp.]